MSLHIIHLLVLLILNPAQKDQIPNKQEAEEMLSRHNHWRAEVGVEPLEWSDDLAKSAAKWAKKLKADKCGFYHSDDSYGENIWKGTSGYYSITQVVDSWGEEIEDYNYKTNKCKVGRACGHYTQIVWRDTKKVGCAQIECDGMTTWVCQYDPPGNWVGEKPY